jgi:drug/metabolite transporter (DMT)-like permease
MSQYMRGVLLVIASALFLSTSGVGLRVIESASAWQILFYRSISMGILVFIILVLFNRGTWMLRFKTITRDDVLLAFVLGSGFVAYVFALLITTVANALFIFSAAPFLAALLGWFLLGERVPLRTSIAIGGAMVGLGIMVGTGIAEGRYLGNLIALWLPISYAISVVLVRRSTQPDMLVALLLAACVAAALSVPFVGQFSVSWWDFGVSVYLGVFQVGLGFTLLILGARHVPAAQVGLLALLEPVLGPIWAWLTVTEIPTTATLWGGLIILSAVILDAGLSVFKGTSDKRAVG